MKRNESPDLAVPRGRRLFVSIVVGVLSGGWAMVLLREKRDPGDFAQTWYAARALLAGQNPYGLIGPGRAFGSDFEFRYPLPAAVAAIPFAPLPRDVASGVFIGLGLACLAWILMRHGHAPLIGLVSAGVASAINSVQWSPVLAAATVIAPLGILLAAKPTIGLAMFAARPSWWAVGGGMLLVAASFVAQPEWLAAWRAATSNHLGISALALHPGGALGLLGLLKWRRPEARMLAALVCVPMAPFLYETVPMLLIPRTWWEATLVVLASYGVLGWGMRAPLTDYASLPAHIMNSANAISLVIVPLATALVLRRPNEGAVPAWLEARVRAWPAWLRGRSFADA
jgi:hypothetical protein